MKAEGLAVDEPVSREPEKDNEPVVNVQDVLLPTLTLVNNRIYEYEEKLKALQKIQQQAVEQTLNQDILNTISDCRVELQNILVEYNALHKRLMKQTDLQAAELIAGDSLLAISQKDIGYLEGKCGQDSLTTSSFDKPVNQVRITSLFEQEQMLKDAFDNNDFSQVINIYEELPLESEQAPPFDVTYLYGQALMKTNRSIEARKVFTDLLATIRLGDQALWEFRLMQLIGDLEFGLEIYDGAREKYKEIGTIYNNLGNKNEWAVQQVAALDRSSYDNDEVREYALLLRSFLEYNPDRDGYTVVGLGEKYVETFPYSTVSSNVDELIVKARKQADDWLDSVFARIDAFSENGQYQQALLFIERIPRSILPIDKQEKLKRKSEELITSESIAIETDRLVVEQEFEADWNKAMTLLEAKQYDRAIEVFTTLLASPYEVKARLRIDEAAQLAAREDRQRAAELYVRSKRTTDFESRKKLLFASRKLLQDILIKYPQSDLTDKVKRNIVRLEEEISSIDPALLNSPGLVGEESLPQGEILPTVEQDQNIN
jgi:tetratricopeptide (TPR) repeat protein